jgi:hypothetical protein
MTQMYKYTGVPGRKVSILAGNSIGPIPNGFPDRSISLYSSKSVDRIETLRTVSDTGIYCSSENLVLFTPCNTFSKSASVV